MQNQLQTQAEQMQNQINEARKAAQQPIITWHRDVLGMGMFGGSSRMWNALLTPTSSVTMGIPMTAAGAESLRNIRNLESQYKSLGGSYQFASYKFENRS
jgi:hypothetical protein